MKQHTQPCKECPFRRIAPSGWLGSNQPQHFAVNAAHEGHFPCHITMTRPDAPECAGRAIMWANQCKVSRDDSVPRLATDREKVFGNIMEFTKHHGIVISSMQLMGAEPLDETEDGEADDDYDEEDW